MNSWAIKNGISKGVNRLDMFKQKNRMHIYNYTSQITIQWSLERKQYMKYIEYFNNGPPLAQSIEVVSIIAFH